MLLEAHLLSSLHVALSSVGSVQHLVFLFELGIFLSLLTEVNEMAFFAALYDVLVEESALEETLL